MKYFIDTEYLERGAGKPIDIVSLAVVGEDGREFYAVSTEFKARHANRWVKDNVLAKLPERCPSPYDSPRIRVDALRWMKRADMRRLFLEFVGNDPTPEFWGWCCAFDYVVVCQLIGFDAWPSGFGYCFRDIQQEADRLGVALQSQPTGVHGALDDARWIRVLWQRMHPAAALERSKPDDDIRNPTVVPDRFMPRPRTTRPEVYEASSLFGYQDIPPGAKR